MSQFQLDLSDPQVREMANRNHVPDEVWTSAGYVSVMCHSCGREWPCMTRKKLRSLETEETSQLVMTSVEDHELRERGSNP